MDRPSYRILLGRFRYQLLSAAMVIMSAGSIVILFLAFGKGAETKSYFLALNVVAFAQLILATPFEQFVYFYLRALKENQEKANGIYSACIFWSMALGAITAAIFFGFSDFVMDLTIPNLSIKDRDRFSSILHQLLIGLTLGIPCQLIQNHASAEGRVTLSYLLGLVPTVILTTGILLVWHFRLSIQGVAIAWSLGYLLAFCTGIFLSRRSLPRPPHLLPPQLKRLVAESTKIRSAHNIHNVCLLQGINIATSGLADNLAAIFFAAKRASDALLFIVNSPIQRTLPSLLVRSKEDSSHIELSSEIDILQRNLLIAYATIAVLCIPALFLLQAAIQLTVIERSFVWGVSALLLAYSAMISLEMPYSLVCLSAGNSRTFWVSNISFATCLLTLSQVDWSTFGTLMLPISMVAAQTIVLINNTRSGKKIVTSRYHANSEKN